MTSQRGDETPAGTYCHSVAETNTKSVRKRSLTELKRILDLQTTQTVLYFMFCEQHLGRWWVCKRVFHHPAREHGHCRCSCLSPKSSLWETGTLSCESVIADLAKRSTLPLEEPVKSPVAMKEVPVSCGNQPSWHLVLPWIESVFLLTFTYKSEQFRHGSLNHEGFH